MPEVEEGRTGEKIHQKDRAAARSLFFRHQDRLAARSCEGRARQAEKGELLAGTIDSFLVWRLTGGKVHATDATNASRTLVYNIEKNQWDKELLKILDIPAALLPDVKDCADDFGVTEKRLFGAEIPILGVAGDQHAATIGQACFKPGMMKSTYGTGCFAVLNTGADIVRSKNRLLTTIAYRLDGKTTYALEGSIFIAGAAVQWLRDGAKMISKAAHSGELAAQADDTQNVYLVPAFVGLGAPHWDAEARGAIFGLTRNSGPAEFARAALEAVAYQTRDLLDAMKKDWKDASGKTVLRVDGGMVASDWTMQRLADILDAPVDRPEILETTALGAAWLAGSRAGVWPKAKDFAKTWALERRFNPKMDQKTRIAKLKGWRDAVGRTLTVPRIEKSPRRMARAFGLDVVRSAIRIANSTAGADRCTAGTYYRMRGMTGNGRSTTARGSCRRHSHCYSIRCCWRSRRQSARPR